MGRVIGSGILFLIAAIAFILSARSFAQKGFLFNNAYLYASEKERKEMDKKPYYRQSTIVFLLIGIIFVLNGLQVLLKMKWLFYAVLAVVAGALVYAIVSSVRRK